MLLFAAALAVTNAAPVATLPAITVEATRIDARRLTAPSPVSVFSRENLADTGAHQLADALARTAPALHVRHLGGGNPALAEFSLRGYGENGHGRTLVVVDGERLNPSDMNAPNLSRIPADAISRLEILEGPQTVLLGDGASAGAVNVTTEPEDYNRKSYAELHGGSWNTFGGALGTRGGSAEDGVRYWANGSWNRSDGFRDNAGYDVENLGAGLRKDWDGGSFLRVTGFGGSSRYELPGALTFQEAASHPRRSHAGHDRLRSASGGFSLAAEGVIDDENRLAFAFSAAERDLHARQRGAGWSSDNRYHVLACRQRVEWISTADLLGLGSEFILGAEHAADDLDGRMRSNALTQHPDYRRHAADAFAQETLTLAEELSLVFGVRLSRAWTLNDLCARDRRHDNAAAGDLALVFRPDDDAKIHAKISHLYRRPFLDEVPGRFDAAYNWVNTEILDPEHGWNAELGASWRPVEEFDLGAAVWCSRLEDEIFYSPAGNNNVNSEDATIRRGVDARVVWERRRTAALSLAASAAKATFDGGAYGRGRIPLVPEWTVAANAKLWLRDDLAVFGGARLQGSMPSCGDFGGEMRKIDRFCTVHLGAAWEPEFAEWAQGLRIALTCDNLLDERYCDYATYGANAYPADGRRIMLSVRREF